LIKTALESNSIPASLTDYLKVHSGFLLEFDHYGNTLWSEVLDESVLNLELVSLLVPHSVVELFTSAIKIAAKSGLTNAVLLLLKSKPYSLSALPPDFITPIIDKAFYYAAVGENLTTMESLLKQYPDLNLNPLDHDQLLTYNLTLFVNLKPFKFILEKSKAQDRNILSEMIEINQTSKPILCAVIEKKGVK